MAKWYKPSVIELAAFRLADLESLAVAIERFIESELTEMDKQVATEAGRAYEEMKDEWPDYWPDHDVIRDFLGLTDRYQKFEEEFPECFKEYTTKQEEDYSEPGEALSILLWEMKKDLGYKPETELVNRLLSLLKVA